MGESDRCHCFTLPLPPSLPPSFPSPPIPIKRLCPSSRPVPGCSTPLARCGPPSSLLLSQLPSLLPSFPLLPLFLSSLPPALLSLTCLVPPRVSPSLPSSTVSGPGPGPDQQSHQQTRVRGPGRDQQSHQQTRVRGFFLAPSRRGRKGGGEWGTVGGEGEVAEKAEAVRGKEDFCTGEARQIEGGAGGRKASGERAPAETTFRVHLF
jgi:hypothetical protein